MTGSLSKKTITTYTYEGDQLVMQTTGNSSLFFLYDANGLIGFDHIVSGTTTAKYYYQIDGKGEIVGITDTAGNVVVKYTYDAWGNPISITNANGNAITDSNNIGIINPFRYKSYYYDTDTGLYYLNSRYYDPQICRFVSADSLSILTVSPTELTDKNLFVYCDNNPVIRKDDGGQFWDIVLDVVSIVTSVINVIKNPSSKSAWAGLAADIVCLALPVVTGGGAAAKAISKADEVVDVAKTVNKSENIADVAKVTVIYGDEIKKPTQIKTVEAVDAWDEFLGPNQTDYNRFTGKKEMNRIFSSDGTRSIRFGNHEMRSFGTPKAHFHYENWIFNPNNNTVYVENYLQRMR